MGWLFAIEFEKSRLGPVMIFHVLSIRSHSAVGCCLDQDS